MDHSIPFIDIGALFGTPSRARDLTDQAIMAAAAAPGFMVVGGFPPEVPTGRAVRAELLRLFQLPEHETRKLWRQKFDASHPNIYRGWFPLQTGFLTAKEGIDMGADVAYGASLVRADDPLREASPLPSAEALPGWRESVAVYYRAMDAVSRALMRAIARGLSLEEHFFDQAFDKGLSTLRLLRYPIRVDAEQTARTDPSVWVIHDGNQCYVNGAPHVDSGFLTLLAQDGISGLQARHRDGTWLDVPPSDDGLRSISARSSSAGAAGESKQPNTGSSAAAANACPSLFSTRRAPMPRSGPCRWTAPPLSSPFSTATTCGPPRPNSSNSREWNRCASPCATDTEGRTRSSSSSLEPAADAPTLSG